MRIPEDENPLITPEIRHKVASQQLLEAIDDLKALGDTDEEIKHSVDLSLAIIELGIEVQLP